jgi:hypothetical protein
LLLFFGTIPFSKNVVWESGETQLTAPNPLFIVEFDYNVFTIPLILAILITGAITLFLRYRDGVRQERLQLGWLLAGVICQFGLLILSTVLAEALNVDSKFVGALYSIIIPITITVALLRYRLYDIDLIIRRTVVYAILTAALGLVYFGSVVVLQTLIGQATEEQSPLVIVFSTLLIAALFSPLRRRIQAFIDRRFYRRKYDAAQTLARFAAAARDEVELEQLTGSIQLAIEQTLQPEGISIWLPKTNTKTH